MAYPPDKKSRPRHLYLTSARLPLPALVSILHRVSGFLLFLAIPLMLFVLQTSLESAQQFHWIMSMLAHPVVKLLIWMLLLAGIHHFFAGLRHLAMNMQWGHGLVQAKGSSKLVLLLDLVLATGASLLLW
jgi:succinate dehydrogenase / fumarate reductase cytochrome b subunit